MAKHKKVDITQYMLPQFDAKTVTREKLLEQMKYWFPCGSGPLSIMKVVMGLLAQIAELRGFEPITLEEIQACVRITIPNEV